MLPGDTQQLRHRLIPPVIQREPLQRPRRRTIAQPLHGLPRLHRVHSFQALNVPRPTDKTSPGRKSTCMTGLYYEMSRATGLNAAHCPTTVDSRPTRMACLRKRSPLTDADSSHPEDHSPVSSRCLVTWGKPPLEGGWMPHSCGASTCVAWASSHRISYPGTGARQFHESRQHHVRRRR